MNTTTLQQKLEDFLDENRDVVVAAGESRPLLDIIGFSHKMGNSEMANGLCKIVLAWMASEAMAGRKEKSAGYEKGLAQRVGGKESKASGATSGDKGDVTTSRFVIQHKYTEKDRFPLDGKLVLKCMADAKTKGKDWALTVAFPKSSVTIMDTELFIEMVKQ